MKRFILLTIWLIAAHTAAAQSPQTAKGSALEFRETTWDFGEIREADGPVNHVFAFTNQSSSPVVVTQVSVSCGCTTPTYSRKPVMSGQTGTIEIAYDPANRPGPFDKGIYVSTSDGGREAIRIRGTVIARPRTVEDDYPIVVAPGVRISAIRADFSYIGQGRAKSMVVGYVNTGDKPVTLTAVPESRSSWLGVSSPGIVCAGCRGEITLTYKLPESQQVWGALDNNVALTVDGKRAETVIKTTAYGVDHFPASAGQGVSDAPHARFDRLFRNFGEVGTDENPAETFTVANEGVKPLIIRAVHVSEGVESSLSAGTEIKPGGEAVFTLRVKTAGRKPGRFFEHATIVLNDPSRPVREIRLSGTIR